MDNGSIVLQVEGTPLQVKKGLTLEEIAGLGTNTSCPVLAAIVDNNIRELTFIPEDGSTVSFLTMADEEGLRIYRRSLLFVLIKSVNELYPNIRVIVHHSLSNGLYCELRGQSLGTDDIETLKSHMAGLIATDFPINKHSMSTEEAIRIFAEQGMEDKVRLLKYRSEPQIKIYELQGYYDYFYGYMVPSTGYLRVFDLIPYRRGVLLQSPETDSVSRVKPYMPMPKLGEIFAESEYWGEVLEVADVGQLNDLIAAGRGSEIVRISEALHEKKVAEIADAFSSRPQARIILISGPSSSGKTTFAQRLFIQLRVNGLKPVSISLDNYFVDRELTPRDENGDYDFEALEAIDLELFNDHILKLLAGETIEMPIFNFITGKREYRQQYLRVEEHQPIIIEGIHGMNDRLTSLIPPEKKFKVYVSALTQLNLDAHNRIPTTDTRIIRRMVRDYQYRGHSAVETIRRWPSVRRGENRNIFPYQEQADMMFNSSLVYELNVLKPYAWPLLKGIDPSLPEYVTAKRLLKFLAYFKPMTAEDVPSNSIVKEFVGGSCFEV